MPQLASGAHWPEEFVNGGDGSSGDGGSDVAGRGLPGVEPLQVTAVAEQVPVQRETAAAFFVTQLHPAVLGERDTQSASARRPGRSGAGPTQHQASNDYKEKGGLEGMDSQKRNLRKYLSWTPGVAAIAKIMRQAPISSGYQETLFKKD